MANADLPPVGGVVTSFADSFAAAWLEKWADAGGETYIAEGKGYIGFRDGFTDAQLGKIHALNDLLGSIPDSFDAVLNHMKSHGITRYYNAEKERVHAC